MTFTIQPQRYEVNGVAPLTYAIYVEGEWVAMTTEVDRHSIAEITRIVILEYERCMEFGMTPAPMDYKIAIECWLRYGMTPLETQAAETDPQLAPRATNPNEGEE